MYHVLLLGGAAIEGPIGTLTGRGVQRARLALLALLVTSPRRSATRERVMTMLWPESDPERARALLRDSLYRLRESLGESAVLTAGDELRLNHEQVRCDVCDFEDAVRSGDLQEADRLYSGPFLDSFFLANSAEFERWVEAERSRLAAMHAKVLESLATESSKRGDHLGAVLIWRRRASSDPYNSRVALKLMQMLDEAGDRSGALHHAGSYEALLMTELRAAPDPEVAAFIEQLRHEPSRHRDPHIKRPLHSAPVLAGSEHAFVLEQEPSIRTKATLGRRKASSRTLLYGAGLVVLLSAVATGVRRYSGDTPAVSFDRDLVAVLPFRVTAPDSSHNYLREGVVDLLSAQLTGHGLPGAIDTRAVMGAYRQAQADADGLDLTAAQSVRLARGLGAGQVIVGEFVATSRGKAISARLLSVPSGLVLAQHSENGNGDELILITRLTKQLLAKSLGEKGARLSGLSDSVEAVRAYLAAMRAYRNGETRKAFDEFGRAIEIDSAFVPAALWRAYVTVGTIVIPGVEKRPADSVAWSFRARVSLRDSLILATLQRVGPNWPRPYTGTELIAAHERAARANPDRPEVWRAWGRHLESWGAQSGTPNHLARAIAAVDSAIAIDSSFSAVIGYRLYLAFLTRDHAALRKFRELLAHASTAGPHDALNEWMVARSLGETSRLPTLLDQIAVSPGITWGNIETWSVFYGLSSLEEAEYVARLRHARSPANQTAALHSLFRIAALRGHVRHALELADSLPEADRQYGPLIMGLAESGYDSAAWNSVRFLEADTSTVLGRNEISSICYTQLWRVANGDTMTARRGIDRMRRSVRDVDPSSTRPVQRLELCRLLVEAAVERRTLSHGPSPALDTVVKLLLRGTLFEQPHNIANLLVARWLEADGDKKTARQILRQMDPMATVLAGPAAFLLEGKVAESLGDKESAIRVYERLLSLRPNPDPGPMADEIEAVRENLSRLKSRRTNWFIRLR